MTKPKISYYHEEKRNDYWVIINLKLIKMETKELEKQLTKAGLETESKPAKELKAEVLSAFMESLDKHTKDRHDLYYVLDTINMCFRFMSDQRFKYDPSVMNDCRTIHKYLEKHVSHQVSTFDSLAESAVEVMIISNQRFEGIDILGSMDEDIKAFAIRLEEGCSD